MSYHSYHFQLGQLLKRFDESLYLTPEQVEISHDFLFDDKKFLPSQVLPNLVSLLFYLKSNMTVNHLQSLNQLLAYYQILEEDLDNFVDDLTEPKGSSFYVLGSELCDKSNDRILKDVGVFPCAYSPLVIPKSFIDTHSMLSNKHFEDLRVEGTGDGDCICLP